MGQGVYGNSVFSVQFCCELKIILKNLNKSIQVLNITIILLLVTMHSFIGFGCFLEPVS